MANVVEHVLTELRLGEPLIASMKSRFAKNNKTVYVHTQDCLQRLEVLNNLGYFQNQRLYELAQFAIVFHDLGKMNPEMAHRIQNRTPFDMSKEIAHNILSVFFIDKNLPTFTDDEYYIVFMAVLLHHYYCENMNTLQSIIEDRCGNLQLKNQLLSEHQTYAVSRQVFKILSAKRNIDDFYDATREDDAAMVLGALMLCDHAASGEYVVDRKPDFLVDRMKMMLEKKKNECGWTDWNEMQRFCLSNTEYNILCVQPTGGGKTEGGLLWLGDNKGYFTLPVRTAINAMYKRICEEILGGEDIENRIALMHSESLNYLFHYEQASQLRDDGLLHNYHKESRNLSFPIGVSTIDQLFTFIFLSKYHEKKLFVMSHSKIIIDEIQMYDAKVLAYLVYAIRYINHLGGKVAILTATLAPFLKDLLLDDSKDRFRAMDFKNAVFTDDRVRHKVSIKRHKINADAVLEVHQKYCKESSNGKSKTIVICNTVKSAQTMYAAIKQKLGDDAYILHKKFTRNDRRELENQILSHGQEDYDGNCIWVTTSVVEASLDIDFDCLLTELSDLTSLFQRFGRCNRRGRRKFNPDSKEELPNCYVFTEIDSYLLQQKEIKCVGESKEISFFIDKDIHNLSKLACYEIDRKIKNGLVSETVKQALIDKYLTTERLRNSAFLGNFNAAYAHVSKLKNQETKNDTEKFRDILSVDVIPAPVYLGYKQRIDALYSEICLLKEALTKKYDRINNDKLLILVDEFMGYTVSVNERDYDKALEICAFELVDDRIIVMSCDYDDAGFSRNKNIKKQQFDEIFSSVQ